MGSCQGKYSSRYGASIVTEVVEYHFSRICEIKLCFEMKSTKLYSKMFLVESSENNFVFLPVFCLIMWLMKASKNFGKMAILKI